MGDSLRGTSNRSCEMLARRHLCLGWWSLLAYLTVGICLELLHGMKLDWYLDRGFENRRLMWSLGHAYGTLIALLNILFAVSTFVLGRARGITHHIVSLCLTAALFLLPGGFLLGGIFLHGDSPGLGVLLVPAGALCLVLGTGCAASSFTSDCSLLPRRMRTESRSGTAS